MTTPNNLREIRNALEFLIRNSFAGTVPCDQDMKVVKAREDVMVESVFETGSPYPKGDLE